MQNRASQYRIEKVTMIKCFLAFLFTVIIAFSSVNVQVLSESESEEVEVEVEVEVELPAKQDLAQTEYYCHATIDQNFADNAVLVVIKPLYGGINKEFSKSQFSTENLNGDVSFKEIKDLTYLDKPIEEYQYLKIGMHKQIFKLTLEKPGKQNVLDTIKELEKLDFIESAEPNYHGTFY